eukprot:scpid48004/ scgid27489/ 
MPSEHSPQAHGHISEAVEHLLEMDEVNEAERDITLDICIPTGEDADSSSRDYSDIFIFLRKLVSNGNIASLEQTLHALKKLERAKSRSLRMSDRVSAISPAHPGSSGTGAERVSCYRTLGYERVEICAKVGGHRRHKLGPKRQTYRQPPLLQSSQSSDPGRQGLFYAPPDIRELVNMERKVKIKVKPKPECRSGHTCSYFNLTLLHCAIFTGNEKMVKCLLRWGADATQTLATCDDDRGGASNHTPVGVAAVLKHADIVKCLLANGASPYDGGSLGPLHNGTAYGLCGDDAATCEALCQNPKYPPLMSAIWSSEEERFIRKLPYCRWDTACCRPGPCVVPNLMCMPELFRESLLGMASFTEAERICKRFWCALNLSKVCCGEDPIDETGLGGNVMHTAELTASFVHSLLQEGTSPVGLSVSDADALCSAWLRVNIEEAELRGHPPVKFKSREELRQIQSVDGAQFDRRSAALAACIDDETKQQVLKLMPPPPGASHSFEATAAAYFSHGTPPVVNRLLCMRTVNDPVVELLVKHGGLPGMTSTVDEIPFVDGSLHDGPSCQCDVELSAAQRKVSLFHVLTPHPKPKALTHLCRSAIIEACHGYGVVKAIQSLDLPPVLMDYLLFR